MQTGEFVDIGIYPINIINTTISGLIFGRLVVNGELLRKEYIIQVNGNEIVMHVCQSLNIIYFLI